MYDLSNLYKPVNHEKSVDLTKKQADIFKEAVMLSGLYLNISQEVGQMLLRAFAENEDEAKVLDFLIRKYAYGDDAYPHLSKRITPKTKKMIGEEDWKELFPGVPF